MNNIAEGLKAISSPDTPCPRIRLAASIASAPLINIFFGSQPRSAQVQPKGYIESLRTNLRQVLVSHAEQYDSFVLHVTFRMKRREIRTQTPQAGHHQRVRNHTAVNLFTCSSRRRKSGLRPSCKTRSFRAACPSQGEATNTSPRLPFPRWRSSSSLARAGSPSCL